MAKESNSDPGKLGKKEFGIEHYIAMWQHYQSRGGSDKDRMVTVVTWLLAFAAGILGFIATEYDFVQGKFTVKGLAVAGSVIGLCICSLSTYLVTAFADYATHNFERAQIIEKSFADLAEVADHGLESRKGWIFKSVGVLFDVFLWCSLLGIFIFTLIILGTLTC